MILKFPDEATLRLALSSGSVPGSVARLAVQFGTDPIGSIQIETSASLSRGALQAIKRLGVEVLRKTTIDLSPAPCWAAVLPLNRDVSSEATSDKTPVLFMLPGPQLPGLVSEMLRLGNDRQSIRWLVGEGDHRRVLLRVIGPPYYSLLRALSSDRMGDEPTAFVERAPRVWVQLGYAHPLAAQFTPSDQQLLLLRPPRTLTFLDDAPWTDVYEALTLEVPAAAVPWRDVPLASRIHVTPTLAAGGSSDGAELWVLPADGEEELNRLVQNADNQLLTRLAFAVGEHEGQRTIVVRVRPSRQAPPVLVLTAIAYKRYLHLPNLFLPFGMRLHPPLRRDAVRELLATDTQMITWLEPLSRGQFAPHSLPEDAFRPLTEWVDYVLDRDRNILTAWMESARFEFDEFICADDQSAPATPATIPPEPTKTSKRGRSRGLGRRTATSGDVVAIKPVADENLTDIVVAPSEARKRCRQLEAAFLAAEGGLDSSDRIALWPEMAKLNALLGGTGDASMCWINALWYQNEPRREWCREWFQVELQVVPSRAQGWTKRLADRAEPDGEAIDALLHLSEPTTADVRAFTAYFVGSTSPELLARLDRVQRWLQQFEHHLPVRAVWLAWMQVTRLTGGDVLTLARARDRLLSRLLSHGLRADQDLPSFLRFGAEADGDRQREVRAWLIRMADRGRAWVEKQTREPSIYGKEPRTADYADLIFAFGLARLGEHDAARRLMQRAALGLGTAGDVHLVLLEAFQFRIEQALRGQPHEGGLPAQQLEFRDMLESQREPGSSDSPRYIIDRLREISRVLEPSLQVLPYRHIYRDALNASSMQKASLALADVQDSDVLAREIAGILEAVGQSIAALGDRLRAIKAILDEAPRLTETLAQQTLRWVPDLFDAAPASDVEMLDVRNRLLERAVFVAAHFGLEELLTPLLQRFERLLLHPQNANSLKSIETLAGPFLRGLRKFGLDQQTGRFLDLLDRALLGEDESDDAITALPQRADVAHLLPALLQVAACRYYLGQQARAEPVVKAARTVLLSGQLAANWRQQVSLATAYIATLGQARFELAQRRLEELFDTLDHIRDPQTTNGYYSQSQLRVIEAIVLAIVSDDFRLGAQARRWLDDDEYLIRKRIHRDLHDLLPR